MSKTGVKYLLFNPYTLLLGLSIGQEVVPVACASVCAPAAGVPIR